MFKLYINANKSFREQTATVLNKRFGCSHVHLVSLVDVAGDPGGVTQDEHHHDGQQQHSHGHVPPVLQGPHPLGPERRRRNK